jgi:hypothetical protein
LVLLLAGADTEGDPAASSAPVAPMPSLPVEPTPSVSPIALAATFPAPTTAAPIQSSGVRIVGPVEPIVAADPGVPAMPVEPAAAPSPGERIESSSPLVTREDLGLSDASGEPAAG